MKHIYGLVLFLVLGIDAFAQSDMGTMMSMTKAEADSHFSKLTTKELTKGVCNGIFNRIKREGGAISIDAITKIINASTHDNSCVQKFEIHKEGMAEILAKEFDVSLDAALEFLDNPETSKNILLNMKELNLNSYCNIPVYRSMFEHGVIFEIQAIYDTNVNIGLYSITAEDCSKIKSIAPVVIESNSKQVQNASKEKRLEKISSRETSEEEGNPMGVFVLGFSLILMIVYFILNAITKAKDKKQNEENNAKKSNNNMITLMIAIVTWVAVTAYKSSSLSSISPEGIGLVAASSLPVSLVLTIPLYFIYRIVAMFVGVFKK